MKYDVLLRELCVDPQLTAELDSVMLPDLYKLAVQVPSIMIASVCEL